MQTKIQRWGNSLGLRIPRSFAAEAQVAEGSTVDLSVENGRLLIRPLRARKHVLADLLKKVNARNVHREVSTGKSVGREARGDARQNPGPDRSGRGSLTCP
jgi:antitoxin MazE